MRSLLVWLLRSPLILIAISFQSSEEKLDTGGESHRDPTGCESHIFRAMPFQSQARTPLVVFYALS